MVRLRETDARWLELNHWPMAPFPRRDLIREGVFADKWREMMEEIPRHDIGEYRYPHFASVLCNMDWPSTAAEAQRDATVAATLIAWLGTNCGSCFLREAQRRKAKKIEMSGERAFIAEWAIDNHRRRGVNGGWRTIEGLLGGAPRQYPKLKVRDYEVMEQVCGWLGRSERAEQFLADVAAEIERRSATFADCKRWGF